MFPGLGEISYIAILDFVLVALVVYLLIMLVRGTRAIQLIVGLGVLFALSFIAKRLGLQGFGSLLELLLPPGFIAIVLIILFQPEIRRVLEEFGRAGFWGRSFVGFGGERLIGMINEVVKATGQLAKDKVGALIVLERGVRLNDVVETGKEINGLVSAELLNTLFFPGNPLHDGAVIIRGNTIVAAGCLLPVSENPNISRLLGLRHKAAMGLTEQSDALVVIVSEETGNISIAHSGELSRYLDKDQLKERLIALFRAPKEKG